MTDAQIFNELFYGGNFTLPFLLKLSHDTAGTIYLVNNNEDVTYDGNTYKAASFEYSLPEADGTGAELQITTLDNSVFEFIENMDEDYSLEIIGAIDNGTVTKIEAFKHYNGSVTVDKDGSATFSPSRDSRQDMTFTPYTYDTTNNKGNA